MCRCSAVNCSRHLVHAAGYSALWSSLTGSRQHPHTGRVAVFQHEHASVPIRHPVPVELVHTFEGDDTRPTWEIPDTDTFGSNSHAAQARPAPTHRQAQRFDGVQHTSSLPRSHRKCRTRSLRPSASGIPHWSPTPRSDVLWGQTGRCDRPTPAGQFDAANSADLLHSVGCALLVRWLREAPSRSPCRDPRDSRGPCKKSPPSSVRRRRC